MPITLDEDTDVYRRFFASAAVLAVALDAEGRVLFVSDRGLAATGTSQDAVIGRFLWEVDWWASPEVAEKTRQAFRETVVSGQAECAVAWFGPDGEERIGHPEFRAARDSDGRVKNVFVIGSDMTAIEAERRETEAALRYGEALLRDANHRAMNSLAIVGSILRHERMRHEDPAIRGALDRLKARIGAISTLYRTLVNRPSNEDMLEARTYLDGVVSEIAAATLDETQAQVDISTDFAEVMIPTDSAIPMGLILNELITNCAKYAFPDEQDGQIVVSLSTLPGQATDKSNGKEHKAPALLLAVTDNGIGPGASADSAPGLGGRLVNSFAAQLSGEVRQVAAPGGGTRVEILIGPDALAPRRITP